jgi:hypothetical protein
MVVPYLSERGQVELDSAINRLRLAVAQQEIDRLTTLLSK